MSYCIFRGHIQFIYLIARPCSFHVPIHLKTSFTDVSVTVLSQAPPSDFQGSTLNQTIATIVHQLNCITFQATCTLVGPPTLPVTEMRTRNSFWRVNGSQGIMLTASQTSVSRLSRQCGILNISQRYRSPRPVMGIALLFGEGVCFLWGTNWTVSTATSSQYLTVNCYPIV
jgi:hypothetical protein